MMPDGEMFVIFSFVIRIVSGIGAATTSTASLTLLSQTFPDDIATAMVFQMSSMFSRPIFLHIIQYYSHCLIPFNGDRRWG